MKQQKAAVRAEPDTGTVSPPPRHRWARVILGWLSVARCQDHGDGYVCPVCAFLGPREPTEREQVDTEERVMTKVIALRSEHDALRADVLRGFKIAHEVTLETQTVEEACSELVRLVRQARMQRDDLWDQLVAKDVGGKRPTRFKEQP